jgi:acetyl-CoA carboxylase carboxyltransferase component
VGALGAVRVLRRRELASAADPAALEKQIVTEYQDRFMNPCS